MTASVRQLALKLSYRPALERADFMVSDCNGPAVAWIDRWPDWPAAGLVLYGPAGAGKSHLAAVWQAASGARPAPARWQDVEAGSAVLVEDIEERLGSGRAAEEELFHLYNSVRAGGGTILVTARSAPARWSVSLPDLASRLRALPAVAIGAPDDVLLAALVAKLFHDRQTIVPANVVTLLLQQVERSFAAFQSAVERIDRLALADRKPITRTLARRALAETAGEGPSEDA